MAGNNETCRGKAARFESYRFNMMTVDDELPICRRSKSQVDLAKRIERELYAAGAGIHVKHFCVGK